MSVNEVIEAVRALSLEERAQVRALLDSLQISPASPEDRLRQRLHEAGECTGHGEEASS